MTPHFLRQGSHWDLQLADLTWFACQQAQLAEIYQSLLVLGLQGMHHHTLPSVWILEIKSGLHTWTADTLPAELFLHP